MFVSCVVTVLPFSPQPSEELQFVWCELLSEALASLWSSSVTSDPERWLKWDPLSPESQMAAKSSLVPDSTVP